MKCGAFISTAYHESEPETTQIVMVLQHPKCYLIQMNANLTAKCAGATLPSPAYKIR